MLIILCLLSANHGESSIYPRPKLCSCSQIKIMWVFVLVFHKKISTYHVDKALVWYFLKIKYLFSDRTGKQTIYIYIYNILLFIRSYKNSFVLNRGLVVIDFPLVPLLWKFGFSFIFLSLRTSYIEK